MLTPLTLSCTTYKSKGSRKGETYMNSLPTIKKDINFNDIADVIGQTTVDGPSMAHSILKINRDHEDDDGRQIPAGSWTTMDMDGNVIYSRDVKLQIFLQRFQYQQYDPDAGETVNKSIMAKNLFPNTEIPDCLGTMRCGSVPLAKRDSLTGDDAIRQKQTSCYRMLYGKASLANAVDADGKDVGDVIVPVLWRARGANFMPLSETLDSLSSQKKPFIFYNLSATLTKKKKGSNVYYVAEFAVDKQALEFTPADQELLHYFSDLVDKENKYVMGQHDKALQSKGIIVDASMNDDTIVDDAITDIDSALDDDLNNPELMVSG